MFYIVSKSVLLASHKYDDFGKAYSYMFHRDVCFCVLHSLTFHTYFLVKYENEKCINGQKRYRHD